MKCQSAPALTDAIEEIQPCNSILLNKRNISYVWYWVDLKLSLIYFTKYIFHLKQIPLEIAFNIINLYQLMYVLMHGVLLLTYYSLSLVGTLRDQGNICIDPFEI